jgi:hypothetical protein
MVHVETPEDARQYADLTSPPGPEGSARVRYAAAMYFYQRGMIGPEALDVFRDSAILDREDPRPALALLGLDTEVLGAAPAAIASLAGEIDRYLSGLAGPGIEDVRAGLARWIGGPIVPHPAQSPVVARFLADALAALAAEGRTALAAAIAGAAPHLPWQTYDRYPPGEIGAAFERGHAYAPVLGPDGCVPAEDYQLGLFLVAPGVFYRDHRHAAPELYAPLTGPHGWRFAPSGPLDWAPAHAPVWNPPHRPHAFKVGPTPFLCIYAWTADLDEAAVVIPADDWDEIEAT